MADDADLEREFIAKYPKRERMIRHALAWLRENEPKWGLSEPMDARRFISSLIASSYDPAD